MELSSGLILFMSALLALGGVYAVLMARRNSQGRSPGIESEGEQMAKDESTGDKDGTRRGGLENEAAAELFAEVFAMRSAMGELVAEIHEMHETLSTMSVMQERERELQERERELRERERDLRDRRIA
jgi:hypothetical protein